MTKTNRKKNILIPIKVFFRTLFNFDLTDQERKTTIARLIEESKDDNTFYTMLFLSSIITVSGIIIDDVSIVIGGMLVAPLLTPMLSFGMAIVTNHPLSIKRALAIIFRSIVLVIIISAIFTILFNPDKNEVLKNQEMIKRLNLISPIVTIFVAFTAGLAAAFAWIKPKLSAALPGVMIATTILPPLVVSGMGLAFADKDIFFISFQIFLINFLLISMASTIIFSLFGFFEARKEEQKIVTKEIKEETKEKKEIEKEIKKEMEKR